MMVAITKPVVNGSAGTWGTILNQALDDIVTAVNTALTAATVTTKGDLYAATASGAVSRLAAGTNGKVLTADSTQATGLKYAYAQAPSFASYGSLPAGVNGMQAYTTDTGTWWTYGTAGGSGIWVPQAGTAVVSCYQTAAQSIPDITYTPVSMGSTVASVNAFGAWSSGSPTRFTAPWPGWYELSGAVALASASGSIRYCSWRKNATMISGSVTKMIIAAANATIVNGRSITVDAVAGDYFDICAYHNNGSSVNTDVSAGVQSSMSAKYLGLAGLQ